MVRNHIDAHIMNDEFDKNECCVFFVVKLDTKLVLISVLISVKANTTYLFLIVLIIGNRAVKQVRLGFKV